MSFGGLDHQGSCKRHGISSLEFDSKGIYLASVTKSGCLMVHDFETLYCQSNVISPWWLKEDEAKHLLHISPYQQLDAVEWNPANQDEVACTSLRSSEVFIFDVAYVSAEPVEVLRKRPSITSHSCDIPKGLSDVAFASSNDSSRVFASDTSGSINIWDRRMSNLPYLELTTNSRSALNSLQINIENQIVLGAGKQGIIYMWDLRGGRTTAAFQNPKEAYYPPMASVKLALLLEKIESLKAQSDIILKEIHSISLDPSCLHRLAFHLDDGWSGVLDIHSLELTHIHCPPPAWLSSSNMSANLSYLRKPSWISTNEIYVAGSSSDDGVYLLDFYADTSSPCHVDYREDVVNTSGARQNRFIPLSEGVTACAAHPLDGSIVAGTKVCLDAIVFSLKLFILAVVHEMLPSKLLQDAMKEGILGLNAYPLFFQQASLLMISQRHHSWRGDDCQ
ncbi:hypothetical protein Nepgr_012140 [Nepenthes gracilis]|uniref:Transducin/WD40 repeat-like superfamily protein n=1 Tax=Nepenthes gracilis TaxID=150966 RepID=A0AAD3SGG4_NEPGR|nr:hypothetical protein Nepgr_012140 [Nepenthes gracilis]